MSYHQKHKPSCKVWIEYRGTPVLGKGGAEILQAIANENSLSKAALKLGMSYRYLWNYIQKAQKTLQANIVHTYKGGKAGGGGAMLTAVGENLLREYQRVENHLAALLSNPDYWQTTGSDIHFSNKLQGKIISIKRSEKTALINIEITTPATLAAVITKETLDKLGLKKGDNIRTIVNSTGALLKK